MDAEEWLQIKAAFSRALELLPDERAAYLEGLTDPAVRAEVVSLLASQRDADDLMEIPAVRLGDDLSDDPETDPWTGKEIGAYHVISRIGRGGMGVVYRAVRIGDHFLKYVALKVVRSGIASEDAIRRFKTERQILASLQHDNIASLLDGGTTESGLPYLIMEYIDGKPIDDYCDSRHLAIPERLKLFQSICAAVQYAHQNLVVHRDIKPGNILVTPDGVPKLLDFGIAKLLEPRLYSQTADHTIVFRPMTPEYASPEQIRGESVTTSSDIYSLGVVLYLLLTGHPPYRLDRTPTHELARIILETEPEKPSSMLRHVEEITDPNGRPTPVRPETAAMVRRERPKTLRRRLSGDLDNIVLKALRKDPARRYVSVAQFSEDISRHLDGLPVLARKDTIRYRTVKFVRRHRMGVAAAALLLVTLVGGVLTTSWQAYTAQLQRARAERALHDVRQLANSLIFDVESAIAELPGSIAARKLLVSTGLRYLDRLAEEAGDDRPLQREVASGYWKLADVQGNPFRPNLGDTGGALESFRKAARMREALAAANPGSVEDRYELAVSYRRLGQMLHSTGDLQAALAKVRKAQAILEPLAQTHPTDLKVLAQTQAIYKLIGDIYGGNGASAHLGNFSAALENHSKALRIAEFRAKAELESPRSRNGVAVANTQVGDDLRRLGERSAALACFRTALTTFRSLAAGPGATGATAARNLGATYGRIGNLQLFAGDARQALASYRLYLEVAEKLAAVDPQNATAKDDLAGAQGMLGMALADSGQAKAGLESLGRAIALLESVVARDPTFADRRRSLATLYVYRAAIRGASGNLDQGLAEYRRAETIFQTLSAADPKDLESMLSAAATQASMAALLMKKGDAKASLARYQSSLAIVEPLLRAEMPSPQALYTVADVYEGIGRLAVKKAQAQSNSVARRTESWKEARSWFERSAQAWRRIPNPERFGPSGFAAGDPQRAAAGMALCDDALRNQNQPEH